MWEALAQFIIETIGLVIGVPENGKKWSPMLEVVVFVAVIFICLLIWLSFYSLFTGK